MMDMKTMGMLMVCAALTVSCKSRTESETMSDPAPEYSTETPAYSYPPETYSRSPSPTGVYTAEPATSRRVSPDDAYDEGLEDGYETGLEDGRLGRCHGSSYDDDSSYRGHYAEQYEEGYAEGYDDGYAEGRDIFRGEGSDEDDEEED